MHLKFSLRGVVLCSASLLASATYAGRASADAEATDQVPEVTVTANRRVENQQNVPIAVTALTGETVSKFNVVSLQSLGEFVPGAVFNRQSNGSIPFIRGIGNPNSTAGDEPSIATYVDDVYMPFPGAGVSNYNSIERIEVMKGPQGTLFGRNATGGVIFVATKDPTPTPSLDATIGYGNYDTTSGSIYATGKLLDTLSGNLALYGSRQNSGWGHNLTTGSPSFRSKYYGGRAKLLWAPSDQTSLLLTLDEDTTQGEEGLDYRGAPGTKTHGGVPAPLGWFDYYSNINDSGTLHTKGISLKATQDLSWSKLVSITAYRTNDNPADYNLTDGPGSSFTSVHIVGKDDTWSQEFRLLSPDEATVQWILGLYYLNDRAKYNPLTIAGILNNNGTQKTESYAGFGQATATILPDTHLTAGLRYTVDDRRANVLFDIGPIPGTPFANCPPGGGSPTQCMQVPGTGGAGSKSFSKMTGRLSLDHKFADDFMGYIAYNRGFKSGLFNLVAILSPLNPVVQPETLDSYSIGEKAEFLHRRLRVNTEAFYYKFKNIQVQEVAAVPGGGFTSFTTNAAAATIKGIDIDVEAIPVEHLTLTASLEYLHGTFDDFPNGAYNVYQPLLGGNCALALPPSNCGLSVGSPGAPPNYDGTNWNLKGNQTPNTPPWSTSLKADYSIPTALGSIDLSLAWNHTGNYYFQSDNGQGQIAPSSRDNGRQKILDLFNTSIGWNSNDGTWGGSFWMRNVTNVHYISFGFETSPATQISPAPPRTFGVTVSKYFK